MLSNFRDHLRTAKKQGAIHQVTNAYVKVRWYSPKAYYRSMSDWRVKRIGVAVGRRLAAKRKRTENRRVAQETRDHKRNTAFANAAGSISDSLVELL